MEFSQHSGAGDVLVFPCGGGKNVPEKLKFVVHARQIWSSDIFGMTSNQLVPCRGEGRRTQRALTQAPLFGGKFEDQRKDDVSIEHKSAESRNTRCNVDVSNGRTRSTEVFNSLLWTKGSTTGFPHRNIIGPILGSGCML